MLRRFSREPICSVIGKTGKAKILYTYTPGGGICQLQYTTIPLCPTYSVINGGGPNTTQTLVINGGGPNTVQICSINR